MVFPMIFQISIHFHFSFSHLHLPSPKQLENHWFPSIKIIIKYLFVGDSSFQKPETIQFVLFHPQICMVIGKVRDRRDYQQINFNQAIKMLYNLSLPLMPSHLSISDLSSPVSSSSHLLLLIIGASLLSKLTPFDFFVFSKLTYNILFEFCLKMEANNIINRMKHRPLHSATYGANDKSCLHMLSSPQFEVSYLHYLPYTRHHPFKKQGEST